MQINLLPDARKKKRKTRLSVRIKDEAAIFSLVGVILAVIVVWAILGLRLRVEQKQMVRLDGQLKSLQSTLQQIDSFRREKEALLNRLEFINQYSKRKILWAKSLNLLSNLTPSGIWLRRIVVHSEKVDNLNKYINLNIEGSAVSLQGEQMIDVIGKFMTDLKSNEFFSTLFSEVKLISSQTGRKVKNIPIMDFKLSCQFQ